MAQLPKIFDQEIEPDRFDPVPAGWYQTRISNAELKQTKAGNGMYVNVCYDILGPSHQGRKIFGMITISNPNRKAEEIGEQQMAQLRSSIGLSRVTDTDQLIGGTMNVKVNVKKDDQYGDKNNIIGWKAIEGGRPPMPEAQSQEEKPAQAPPKQDVPPWLQGK